MLGGSYGCLPYINSVGEITMNAKEEFQRIINENPDLIDFAIALLEDLLQTPDFQE